MSIQEDKSALRKLIRQRCAMATEEDMERESRAVMEILEDEPAFQQASTILLYHAMARELRTWDMIWKWSKRKRVLLPRVEGSDLSLIQVSGPEDLKEGAYGIMEPQGPVFTYLDQVSLAVIPGVAFDRSLRRMGHGKGYYDRLLPALRHARKIGVCYSWQVVDAIPSEEHDIRMDQIIFSGCAGQDR